MWIILLSSLLLDVTLLAHKKKHVKETNKAYRHIKTDIIKRQWRKGAYRRLNFIISHLKIIFKVHKWQNFQASIVIIGYGRLISSVCLSGQWSIFLTWWRMGIIVKGFEKRKKYSLHVYTVYLICMIKGVSETKVSFCDVYVFVLIFK